MNSTNGVIDNSPNPAKLMHSLREGSGYNTLTALLDLIDNSIDALSTFGTNEEKRICVYIPDVSLHPLKYEEKAEIYIIDNGCGMNWGTLDQALRLGSDTDRDPDNLGRFGLGLVTASISICKQITVLTKSENGPVLVSSTDLDKVMQSNSFTKVLRVANEQEVNFWKSCVKDNQGTVIKLSKIDHIDQRLFTLLDTLRKEISITYHTFIDKEYKFYTLCTGQISSPYKSHRSVKAFDPLQRNDIRTNILVDNKEVALGKGKFFISAALVPDETNPTQQEIFAYRNGRLIKHNRWGLFSPSGALKGLRIYLETGQIDDYTRINFNKSSFEFDSRLLKTLKVEVDAIIHMASQINNSNHEPYSNLDYKKIVKGMSELTSSFKVNIASFNQLFSNTPKQRVKVGAKDSEVIDLKEVTKTLKDNPDLLENFKQVLEKGANKEEKGAKKEKTDDKISTESSLSSLESDSKGDTFKQTSEDDKNKRSRKINIVFTENYKPNSDELYDIWLDGKNLVIAWNSHHSYHKYLSDPKTSFAVVTQVHTLIASYAIAEIQMIQNLIKSGDLERLHHFDDYRYQYRITASNILAQVKL